jgi:hypothetical protein
MRSDEKTPNRPRRPPRPAVLVADETPAALRRKPARRARALPEGPFPVPVSTLDWLLSRESPAARSVTLRDLLGRTTKDPELKRALREFPRDPYVRDLRPLLARRLAPGGRAEEIERRYDGGLWQTLLLVEIGGGPALEEIHRAGQVFLAHWERSFLEIARGETLTSDPVTFCFACRALARCGYAEHPYVLSAVEYLARRRMAAERQAVPASKDLLLFASIPEALRTEAVRDAIAFTVERAVHDELSAVPADPSRPIVFPAFDQTGPLEVLEALAEVGVGSRPGVTAALSILVSRADHRARWKLERPPAAPMLLELEAPGELSRWVTLRALRVLQHFQGLTTTAVERRS